MSRDMRRRHYDADEVEYAGLDLLLFCACFSPVTRLVKGVWLKAEENTP